MNSHEYPRSIKNLNNDFDNDITIRYNDITITNNYTLFYY